MSEYPRLYYQDDLVSLYLGDSSLGDLPDASLVLVDPPYGISYRSTHNTNNPCALGGATRENFLPIHGDDAPFDPTRVLALDAPTAIFGGNYCADSLPPSRCWITWNKRFRSGRSSRQADCELIWTNFPKPSRIYDHVWQGICREGEENVSRSPKLHPHQKPVALLRYVMNYSGTEGLVLDTHAGSGSTLAAAKSLGRQSIGFEISEKYCEVAAKRLSA